MKKLDTLLGYMLFLLVLPSPLTASAGQALMLKQKADSLMKVENYPQALEYYIKAMEHASDESDRHIYIVSTGYVGNIYSIFGDNNSSVRYWLKSYVMARQENDSLQQSMLLANIVLGYCRQGELQNAKVYFELEKAIRPSGPHANEMSYAIIYREALILGLEKKYDRAIAKHLEAAAFAHNNQMHPACQVEQDSEITRLLLEQGRLDEAIALAHRCEQEAERLGNGDLQVNALRQLARAYAQKGNQQEAYNYGSRFLKKNDSIYNVQKFYHVRQELADYENRQHSEHVTSLNSKLIYSHLAIGIIGVFLLILAVFAFVIVRTNRNLKSTQILLINKNQELQRSDDRNRQLLANYLNDHHEDAADQDDLSAKLSPHQVNVLQHRIIMVMEDIEKISNPAFNLKMLADAVGSNTSYVSWVINDTYGKNFKTLLNERRIQEACRRLTDREHYGNKTIQSIYEGVGYTNAVSFISAFKKINGMTPSSYQRHFFEDSGEP
ncbi:MAG: AraC family transcriptional regulator [Prevotella sp.]|nr:AraC family transcriptional regulator [Prevotella sp.]